MKDMIQLRMCARAFIYKMCMLAHKAAVSLDSPYEEEDQGDSVAALFASSPVYCTVYTVANQSRHACV